MRQVYLGLANEAELSARRLRRFLQQSDQSVDGDACRCGPSSGTTSRPSVRESSMRECSSGCRVPTSPTFQGLLVSQEAIADRSEPEIRRRPERSERGRSPRCDAGRTPGRPASRREGLAGQRTRGDQRAAACEAGGQGESEIGADARPSAETAQSPTSSPQVKAQAADLEVRASNRSSHTGVCPILHRSADFRLGAVARHHPDRRRGGLHCCRSTCIRRSRRPRSR